ncbi:LemA protein [Cyclonatronum proteinivorum]|uniref:LemA protein n=1 Tax=Cyclonatronum proteinivorum TaxID=1457365 RepID=A0A345UMW3_9BACT|nr:LemA family protein [Cyclonatronum proteinivorum]AXJ01815.1 LemA protein [Cyclonatronum proteinivorum]
MTIFIIAVVVIPILFIIWAISIYNGLVTLRNRYKNAFSQIDVQLKRRYDLIPNLVETAKGYMKHERETLEAVIKARNQAVQVEKQVAADPTNPDAFNKLKQSEQQLSGVMSRFFALSESYPDLKANQNMMQITEELTSTENKISFARQAFNDSVMNFNTQREKFPNIIFSNMFGFREAPLFELDNPAEERENVRVSFT